MGNTSFTTTAVYGNSSSIMVAERPGGYHSRPHVHHCEQLNILQSGELWVFVDDQAYHLRPGDYMRIPAGRIHWSWNKSDASCVLLEVHAPGLHADPLVSGFAVGLFEDGETPDFTGSPVNEFLHEGHPFDPSIAESRSS
jgi:mannose-6-phosphate isomerase-like protein (cupin superfamily)